MIELQGIVKNYGEVRAVDDIGFQVNKGEIVGFLGPNGAGKSTTLKMITTYLTPTAGKITIDDLNTIDDARAVRKLIGYLPEHNPLYTEMTVYDYLKFVADARDIPKDKQKQEFKRVIEKCGLKEDVSKQIQTLSKGYRQRVGLAQAIIHDPKILILDEPTTGLDPNQILEIRELIKELGKYKTLIISSHISQEVQAVCDRIIIINKGKIVADGSTEELKASFQGKTRLNLELMISDEDLSFLQESLPAISLVSKELGEQGTHKLIFEYDKNLDYRKQIFQLIKEKNWDLYEMFRENISLEDVFRNLTIENKDSVGEGE